MIGRPSLGGLHFPECVIYRGEQAYPQYLVTYQIVNEISDEESSTNNELKS